MKTKQQLEAEISELRRKQEALFVELHGLEALPIKKRPAAKILEIESKLDDLALELSKHYKLERIS